METIPLTAVLLTGGIPDALVGSILWRGSHGEVPLDELTRVCGAERALAAAGCWERSLALWGAGSGEGVLVERVVVDARQTDGKSGRADLAEELEALMQLPAAAAVCDAVLEREIDEAALAGCETTRDGAVTRVRFSVSAPEWPDALGGTGCPGEIRRTIEITANHAKWRDRRVRRLQAVTVCAEEVWATV